MNLVLQFRAPYHGLGRHYAKTEVGHGCLTLLSIPTKKMRITLSPSGYIQRWLEMSFAGTTTLPFFVSTALVLW
jgi:hypothetical protein